MTADQIIAQSDHRPWVLPDRNWKFSMEWNRAIFLHWPADYGELRKFVPEELEIDLFEGRPWVSMVAFDMAKVRPRNFISFPPVSDFPELNVRTYLKKGHKTGVYFLSLEAGKRLSALISNKLSGLPYRFSHMHRDDHSYRSENIPFHEHFLIEYTPGKLLSQKSDLDTWLTERYALFQESGNRLIEYEIHHVEWPIREIGIKHLEYDYPRFAKLLAGPPHLAHYSEGVGVVAYPPNLFGRIP